MALDGWFDQGTSLPNLEGGESGSYSNPDNAMYGLDHLSEMWSGSDGYGDPNGHYLQGNDQERGPMDPNYLKYLNDNKMSFQGRPDGYGGSLSQMFKNGQSQGTKTYVDDSKEFGGLLNAGIMAFTGGAFGPGAAMGLTGASAGALGGALGNGIISGGNGGSFAKGALTGAIGGGLGGALSSGIGASPEMAGNNLSAYSPAQAGWTPSSQLGITNPMGVSALNGAIGGGVTAGASGGNVGQGALMGGITGGLNKMNISDFMSSVMGGDSSNTPLSSNPYQNASYPEGPNSSQQLYSNITGTDTPQMSSPAGSAYSLAPYNASMGMGPQSMGMSPMSQPQGNQPQKQPSSSGSLGEFLQNPSLGAAGNWAGNHAGDLASMMYGLYTQNKQRSQQQQMMNGLSGLYSPNGAYATQLRNTLMAKDAAAGRRSNYAGRETELMANLAGHNAQLMPAMYQMQQGQNNNTSNQMNMMLQGMNKLGGWDGLKSLFNQTPGG